MKRILLALVASAAFAIPLGISPVTSSTAEARPWVRAGVRIAAPPYRPYYRPYYGGYYRPYYYGGYYRPYYRPYYTNYYYYYEPSGFSMGTGLIRRNGSRSRF